MTRAEEKHAKLDITFTTSCRVLLYLINLCHLFWLGWKRKKMFGRNLANSPSHFLFLIFSLTSKQFWNHDVNIKRINFIKSYKFNDFVLALFCILGLGQNFTLDNTTLTSSCFPNQQTFLGQILVPFPEGWIIIGRVESKRRFSDDPRHNVLELFNK